MAPAGLPPAAPVQAAGPADSSVVIALPTQTAPPPKPCRSMATPARAERHLGHGQRQEETGTHTMA